MTPPEKLRHAWIPLAAALLAVVVYCNALTNDFVWDDNELIVNNPSVHDFSEVHRFFSSHFWSQSGQPTARGYYRPLILLSYAADYALWGPNPLGFHAHNILWHALASALACMLVMRLLSSPAAGLVAGAMFAVHPVHVESVAFISGRTDVIATALMLISMHLFFKERRERTVTFRLPLSILFFALALLAKEIAVVLPPLLMIGEATVAAPREKKRRALVHGAYWLVAAMYLAARFGLLGIRPELQGRLTAKQVLLTMPSVVADYARLLILPIGLCADYAVKVQHGMTPGNIAVVVGLLLACGAIGFLILKKRVSGFFGAWIFIGLAPVLQIVPISVLKAERFLYLPSVGFCALAGLLAGSLYDGAEKTGKRLLGAAFALIIVVFSIQTLARNTAWKDDFTLYRVTEARAPDNFRVQYNLGNAYFRAGDIEGALRHTEKAFRLRPDFPRVNYNLGLIYERMGRLDQAEKMYRRAIKIDAAYAFAHNNLAALLYADGRIEEARNEWLAALSLDPNLPQAAEGLRLLEQGERQ